MIFIENTKIVSVITSWGAWIIGLFTKKTWEKIKVARCVRGLRLNRKRACRIILPTYKEEALFLKNDRNMGFELAGKEDVRALFNVISLVQKMRLKLSNINFLTNL